VVIRLKAVPSASFLVPLCLLVLVGCAAERASTSAPPTAAAPQRAADAIYIGTAGVTGVYYPAGGAICRLVNQHRAQGGLQCQVESTDGSAANIAGIEAGELDFGIVQSDLQYEAYRGLGRYAGECPFSDLRSVFSLHAEPFTVVALNNSGITTFADLPGKRVNIGNPGSGQRATMDVVMEAKGMTADDLSLASELKATEQAQALCDNKIDAFVYQVGHPNGSIQEAFSSCDAHFVSVTGPEIDQLIADNPFYAAATIPASLYEGIESDTETFGVRATFVSSADVPNDVVYQVTKAVFDNFDRFKGLHPAFSNLNQEEMISAGLSAPLHDGAKQYYEEQGWLDGGS
jgi:TRAP transporter TAXI family solute receptor